jgi:hypothetical protein
MASRVSNSFFFNYYQKMVQNMGRFMACIFYFAIETPPGLKDNVLEHSPNLPCLTNQLKWKNRNIHKIREQMQILYSRRSQ